ncbi:retrovirus-related pol polyprotein from transposon TNT 1-94 [Tanacetum coccineum]
MVDGDRPPKDKGQASGSEGSNIDQYDLLFLLSNDTSRVPLINFKLEGTENYKAWKAAITIAIHTTNKLGFINGKLTRPEEEDVFMGQVLDETYAPIRSIILTIDPIPDVKGAFATLSRDESHKGSQSHNVSKSGNSAFVARPYNKNNNWNANNNQPRKLKRPNLVCTHCNINGHTAHRCFELVGYLPNFKKNNNNGFNKGTASSNVVSGSKDQSTSNSFTDDQYKKLMALSSEKSGSSSMPANIAGINCVINFCSSRFFNHNSNIRSYKLYIGWIIDSGASQHMTYIVLNMFNVVEFSKLNMTDGHPNGTKTVVTHVGSLRLTDQIVIHDVLVVSGYEFRLLSMHKLSKDNKFRVLFDENVCVIQDFVQRTQVGTDSVCDVCHKAKQTRDPFPLSEHQTKVLGQIVQLDVCGPYKVQSREGFRCSFPNVLFDWFVRFHDIAVTCEPTPGRLPEAIQLALSDSFLIIGLTALLFSDYLLACVVVSKVDEAGHPDNSDSAEAVSNVEENAILKENDKESKGDDSFYQEFKEMFEVPNVIPNSQSDINPIRSSRKTIEDVYMSLPDGYFDKSDTRVYKLVKSLYGLKHAPRKWNEKLTSVLLENDFKQSKSDFSLFIKNKNGVFIFLLVHVDDIVITGLKVLQSNGILTISKKELLRVVRNFGMLPYMHAPLQSHLKLAFRVLRYLKNAPRKGISFCKSDDMNLSVFVDSDWAKCKTTRKSIIGYVVFMGKNLVSWKSKKQSMLSKSSAEAEYKAMNSVTCEVIWIIKVLAELNIETSLPVSLHCDNSSAIQIAANLVFYERTKHFEIELYFLREKVSAGIVKTVKVKSVDNTIDIFTKGLSVCDHNKFCDNLGLYDLYRVGLRGNIENIKPTSVSGTKVAKLGVLLWESRKQNSYNVRQKRNQLSIRGVLVEGDWVENPNMVKNEFLNHFKNRFDRPKSVRPMLNMEFPHHLNSMQQLDLEAEVFWSLIEKDVLAAVKYFFHYSRIPKGCNSSFIALIPKTPEAKMVKDFRPISLIGSLYKIIAKILANRLVVVLGDIVNEVQSAFVADRQILDGRGEAANRIGMCVLKALLLIRFEKLGEICLEINLGMRLLDKGIIMRLIELLCLNGFGAVTTQKNLLWTRVIKAISCKDGKNGSGFRLVTSPIGGSIHIRRWKHEDKRFPEVSTQTRWIKAVPIKGIRQVSYFLIALLAKDNFRQDCYCGGGFHESDTSMNSFLLRKSSDSYQHRRLLEGCVMGVVANWSIVSDGVISYLDIYYLSEDYLLSNALRYSTFCFYPDLGVLQYAILCRNIKLDEVSYHKLFNILKQYQKEVNELRAERMAKNAYPLALVATAQTLQDPYYQTSKPHKSYAPTSKASLPTKSHATTRYKGKEIAKPITPPSESASEEDKFYKPTNNNLRTSSNTKNKNVDTTPRYKNDNQTGQFGIRIVNVVGARETVGGPVVQQSGIQCFNCKEFGVQLHAEKSDWLADTNEEIDEQELEAHYSYMAKIQEVPNADSGTDTEPLEQDDQNDVECDDERVALANLIANLKLDVDENKKIQKQLKKANATLTQDLLIFALQNKQTEFERYKAFNDRTVDYDKLERRLNETLGLLAQKEIDIKEGLKVKAYEISVVKEKHDELVKQSLLTKSHYEVLSRRKQRISNIRYAFARCVSKQCYCSYLQSSSDLDEITELQCLYLHKVRECDCLAQKLSEQTDFFAKKMRQMYFRKEREQYFEIQDLKAQLQDKNIAISELKKLIETFKRKGVDTNIEQPSILGKPPVQSIRNQPVVRQPTAYKSERYQCPQQRFASQVDVSNKLTKPATPHSWHQMKESSLAKPNDLIAPGPSRNCPKHVSLQSPREKKDKEVNGKPSMIDPTRLPNTANGCKPKPRNWQASMSSRVSNKDVHLGEHRKQKPFLKFNDLQCPTCKKCLYSANHDECVLEYLSRLNPRAFAQNAKSHKTTKRYMPVEKSSASKKPERQIPTGHRFSNKKTTTVPEKIMNPRSCLRWQLTGRILKTVGLRWVPTGKLFNSCTSKVESEPTHGIEM